MLHSRMSLPSTLAVQARTALALLAVVSAACASGGQRHTPRSPGSGPSGNSSGRVTPHEFHQALDPAGLRMNSTLGGLPSQCGNDQYPAVAVAFESGPDTVWDQVVSWQGVELQPVPPGNAPRVGLTITVDRPGNWTVVFAWSPFVIGVVNNVAFNPPSLTREVVVEALLPILPKAYVQVFRKSGSLATGVEVQLPSLVRDPDPLDPLTDSNGTIAIDCVNWNPIYATVGDLQGCYDGEVRFNQQGFAQITLADCDPGHGRPSLATHPPSRGGRAGRPRPAP